MSGYPEDANDVIGPRRYRLPTREAVKKFRSSKPWRGTFLERKAKFDALLVDLCAAYRITCRLEVDPDAITNSNSFDSHYANGVIYLTKFSVVTILHEFAHAMGKDEPGACDWSINLFRIMFPNSFRRCRFDGHLVLNVRPALPRRGNPPSSTDANSLLLAELRPIEGETPVARWNRIMAAAARQVSQPAAPVQTPDAEVATQAVLPPLPRVTEFLASQAAPVAQTAEGHVVQPVGDELAIACECLDAVHAALAGRKEPDIESVWEDSADLASRMRKIMPRFMPS